MPALQRKATRARRQGGPTSTYWMTKARSWQCSTIAHHPTVVATTFSTCPQGYVQQDETCQYQVACLELRSVSAAQPRLHRRSDPSDAQEEEPGSDGSAPRQQETKGALPADDKPRTISNCHQSGHTAERHADAAHWPRYCSCLSPIRHPRRSDGTLHRCSKLLCPIFCIGVCFWNIGLPYFSDVIGQGIVWIGH